MRSSGGKATEDVIALALVFVLLSALATEAIGVHAIFGAFLFGAVIPHDSDLARTLERVSATSPRCSCCLPSLR